MAIDLLQNKIRKFKNPSAVILAPVYDFIPEGYGKTPAGAADYCRDLLTALKDLMPAVRFDFTAFALLGCEGIAKMQELMRFARELGYYVILDWMILEKAGASEDRAKLLLQSGEYPCDGIILCGYAGSDCVKPYISAANVLKQDVYVVAKTSNKSGVELQDLQTGGRLVHMAVTDYLNRWEDTAMERCGYSRIAAMVGATSAAMLANLRKNYPKIFLLIDGLDVSGSNARNASEAFDRFGHGALCCSGSSIVGAWKECPDADPVTAAVEAAERMRRNITRYVTIL